MNVLSQDEYMVGAMGDTSVLAVRVLNVLGDV